jgi:succinate dehydrogenase / fumarate reductase membrane anchor subunit
MDLRTPLGKVKGLGSAKSGTHHWWMQRVTALALIPLVIWFVVMVIKASVSADRFVDMLSESMNSVALILFICVALYHGILGFRIIVEDYVHCGYVKNFLLIATNFFTAVTAVLAVLAIIYFHVGGPPRNYDNGDKSSSRDGSVKS